MHIKDITKEQIQTTNIGNIDIPLHLNNSFVMCLPRVYY